MQDQERIVHQSMYKLAEKMKILEGLHIPYCFCGSTLLGIVLEGKPFENDWETDVLVSTEYRDTVLHHMIPVKKNPWIREGVTGNGNIRIFLKFWDTIGFSFYIQKEDYILCNYQLNHFWVIPSDFILPFRALKTIPVPNDYKKYLEYYYGKEWRIRQLDWKIRNFTKRINASSYDEALKIYKEKK